MKSMKFQEIFMGNIWKRTFDWHVLLINSSCFSLILAIELYLVTKSFPET